MSRRKPVRLGVMIGGGGRTLLNIADHIDSKGLAASIEMVIASRDDIPGVEKSIQRGFETRVVNAKAAGSPEAADDEVNRLFREAGVDLICMAGYIRHFRFDESFCDRIMNIHPALLPAFGGKGMYGMNVHRAVLEHGCKVSGCTVHFVDDAYDNGPIILQKSCPVQEGDTPESLAARVFELECAAYPEAIALFAEGRLSVHGRRVSIGD